MNRAPSVDSLTTAAIALVVYTASSILHEAVGHGLTCVALGGKVACIASTVCIPADPPLGQNAARTVAAAGTIVNLLSALVFWALLRLLKSPAPLTRYFLWLSMTVNGFIGAGYMAVPTLIGFGDWMNVLQGVDAYWLWRVTIVVSGVVLYGVVAYVAVRELKPFPGGEVAVRTSRLIKLTVVPYLAGGLAFCAAGLFNPVGMKLVLISAAAASFGGTAGLPWLAAWAREEKPRDGIGNPPLALNRNGWWIALGIASAAFLICILGRGVRFNS